MPKYQSKPQLSGLLQRRKQNLKSLCEDWGTLTSLDFKQRLDREGLEATEQEVGAVDLIFNVGGSVVFPKGLAPKTVHKAPEVVSPSSGEKVPVASESVSEVAKKVVEDHAELLEKLADGDSYESKRAKKKKSSEGSDQ